MAQPPVIFFIGPPKHGKSTARNIVCELTGLVGASCSDFIYHFLALRKKVDVSVLRAIPKETFREELIECGDWMCKVEPIHSLNEKAADPDIDGELYRCPSAIVRALYHSGVRVIDGVRRRTELNHAREHLDWCGVRTLVFWVQKPGGPKVKDNTDITKEFADEVVVNDGSIIELRTKLASLLEKYFAKPKPAVPVVASVNPEGTILSASGNPLTK
jgi:hypothetical protein